MSNTEREALLPCPFCGHVGLEFAEGSTFRWIVASCGGCGASRGETRIQTLGDGTNEEWMADAQEDAIREWNRRASTPQAPGAAPDGWSQNAQTDAVVSSLYRKFKEWSKRGFGPDDVTWCEVRADVHSLVLSQTKDAVAAISFAIEQGNEAAAFLRCWSEGDTSEWPDFAMLAASPPPPAQQPTHITWNAQGQRLVNGRLAPEHQSEQAEDMGDVTTAYMAGFQKGVDSVKAEPLVMLTSAEIEEHEWHLDAEREYERYTGQESLAVTGSKEFARAAITSFAERNGLEVKG